MRFRIRSFESISSTNDVVKQAIEAGEAEGLAVRALRQTAGYGRQGRAWESPVGGMYQSFLLRPQVAPAQLPTLSLLVGLAVRRAVVGLVPALENRVQVKWPNDLVVAWDDQASAPVNRGQEGVHVLPRISRGPSVNTLLSPVHVEGGEPCENVAPSRPRPFLKLGGISTEMHAKALCVGVGINVAKPDAAQVPTGKNIPVHLDELGFAAGTVEQRIEAVADALCDQLAELYPRWCEQGFAPFQAEFDAHAALTGRLVRMEDLSGNVIAAGEVVRVAPDGRLVLRAPDGGEVLASSGEAHIR